MDTVPTTGEQVVRDQFYGMTLRDWFAGQAIPMLKKTYEDVEALHDVRLVAERAYRLADAMLKARST